jgi:hypothetical protein
MAVTRSSRENVPLLIILIIVAISFGTLVELTPLIFSKQLASRSTAWSPTRRWNSKAGTSTSARAAIPATRRWYAPCAPRRSATATTP